MARFLCVKDGVGRHGHVDSTVFTDSKLQSWRNKNSLTLFTHVYSNAISSSAVFKNMKKTLITPVEVDRAGAETQATQNELTERLIRTHSMHYSTQRINWQMWANQILASPAHQQDAMVTVAPPQNLIHLFAMAPDNHGITNRQLFRSNQVPLNANRHNQSVMEALAVVHVRIQR